MSDLAKLNPKERFSNRAGYYSKARPDYANEALEFIMSHCRLEAGKKVVDMGAGTGISSRAFATRGLTVCAVEPNQAMLDQAMAETDFADRISYIKAGAEQSGLASESFDAVLCAQSFHWFEPEKALSEFNRLLLPSGWVILVWNERDESDEFTKAYGDLLRSLPDTKQLESKRARSGLCLMDSDLFGNKCKKTFAHEQVMNLDKLVGRAFSASYAPFPDSQEALEFQNKLQELFHKYQSNEQVVMKYESSVYLAQKPAT